MIRWLGISNEIPLMEINWLTADAPVSFVDKAYSKIMPMLARDEDKSLHVSVQDDGEAERLQSILEAWITSEFGVDLNSQEFSDLKKYLLAKEKEHVTVDMEKKMEQRKKLPSWQPMVNAISYYLDVLSNWNKVVVFDARLIETNSEDEIFSHWQEVL